MIVGSTKATVHPVERSGRRVALRCHTHILSTAAADRQTKMEGGLQRLQSADDVAREWLKTYGSLMQSTIKITTVGQTDRKSTVLDDAAADRLVADLVAADDRRRRLGDVGGTPPDDGQRRAP